jgi:hypothetical protein
MAPLLFSRTRPPFTVSPLRTRKRADAVVRSRSPADRDRFQIILTVAVELQLAAAGLSDRAIPQRAAVEQQ